MMWRVCVWLFATSWTVALQAPLSMGSSGKNTRVGCHFLLWGIFVTQGLNPYLLCLLHWQADSLPLAPPGKPYTCVYIYSFLYSFPLWFITGYRM